MVVGGQFYSIYRCKGALDHRGGVAASEVSIDGPLKVFYPAPTTKTAGDGIMHL